MMLMATFSMTTFVFSATRPQLKTIKKKMVTSQMRGAHVILLFNRDIVCCKRTVSSTNNICAQDQYTSTTLSMAFSTLAQLAEQSKQLTSHIGGLQVPQIKRGIDQIESESRKLASKASKPSDGAENKG